VGLNTTLTYFTERLVCRGGHLVTGFAPEILRPGACEVFGGGGGIRIGSRRERLEPGDTRWVGGGHLQPQTEDSSRNAFMVQAGGGVDFRVMIDCPCGPKAITCSTTSSASTRTTSRASPASSSTSERVLSAAESCVKIAVWRVCIDTELLCSLDC